jgi:asparagine synthase (glutamine-hydrolysing)
MLSFNGEIYNFRELSSELRKAGIHCGGESDTEVLFKCLTHWGIDRTLAALDGMFAFVYFNTKDRSLYIARDPLGEKPLYWAHGRNRLWVSSEIKVILATGEVSSAPNLKRIDDYFYTGKINGSETSFDKVFEVEPGTYLHLTHGQGDPITQRYWHLEDFSQDSAGSWGQDLIGQFEFKLQESIASRRISDVPIGLLLSGGIDSNSILEMSLSKSPEDSISLFFADNKYKEVTERSDVDLFVESMAKRYPGAHLPLYSKQMSFESYMQALNKLTWFYDEPVQFPITPQFVELNRLAYSKGIKVLLSGEGADEILYGYDRFVRTSRILANGGDRRSKIENAYYGGGIHNVDVVKELTNEVADGVASSAPWRWLEENVDKWDFDIMQMIFSQKYRLQTLLQRQDRSGMSESVEVRVPFLAPQFVKWCNTLPMTARFDSVTGETKRILREVMKNRLPKRILEKKKQGSTSDVQVWLKSKEMEILCRELVDDKNGFCQTYLNGKCVSKIIDSHFTSTRSFDSLVWMMLSIELWHRTFHGGVKMPQPESGLNYSHGM